MNQKNKKDKKHDESNENDPSTNLEAESEQVHRKL